MLNDEKENADFFFFCPSNISLTLRIKWIDCTSCFHQDKKYHRVPTCKQIFLKNTLTEMERRPELDSGRPKLDHSEVLKAGLRGQSPPFLRITTYVSQIIQFLMPTSNTFTLFITVKLRGANQFLMRQHQLLL